MNLICMMLQTRLHEELVSVDAAVFISLEDLKRNLNELRGTSAKVKQHMEVINNTSNPALEHFKKILPSFIERGIVECRC